MAVTSCSTSYPMKPHKFLMNTSACMRSSHGIRFRLGLVPMLPRIFNLAVVLITRLNRKCVIGVSLGGMCTKITSWPFAPTSYKDLLPRCVPLMRLPAHLRTFLIYVVRLGLLPSVGLMRLRRRHPRYETGKVHLVGSWTVR